MLQHVGLISILILMCGLLFVVRRWPGGLHMTFSQHVARSRSSIMYYSVLFAVALPLLYVFLANWFAPTFGLPAWFTVFAAISVITQFLCTLVPETGGNKTVAHRVLTGTSGITMLPLMVMISVGTGIPQNGRAVATVSLVAMVLLLAIALSNQRGHPYSLLLQVGYYGLFFAPVLYITYL